MKEPFFSSLLPSPRANVRSDLFGSDYDPENGHDLRRDRSAAKNGSEMTLQNKEGK